MLKSTLFTLLVTCLLIMQFACDGGGAPNPNGDGDNVADQVDQTDVTDIFEIPDNEPEIVAESDSSNDETAIDTAEDQIPNIEDYFWMEGQWNVLTWNEANQEFKYHRRATIEIWEWDEEMGAFEIEGFTCAYGFIQRNGTPHTIDYFTKDSDRCEAHGTIDKNNGMGIITQINKLDQLESQVKYIQAR